MFVKCVLILIVLSSIKAIYGNNFTLKRVRRSKRECGITSESTGLILGGNIFPRGSWPWMVALMKKTSSPPIFFCGGVLVSSIKILTGELNISIDIRPYLRNFLKKDFNFFLRKSKKWLEKVFLKKWYLQKKISQERFQANRFNRFLFVYNCEMQICKEIIIYREITTETSDI